jgi:Region found in RelA / SpoT proteins
MRIPDSVTFAYEEELALLEPLRHHASRRLRILAANNSWLFDDRVKSSESALSKMESGRSSLRDMNDLYAAMIVVPTQKHVAAASDAILTSFSGEVRPARPIEASSFVYDDVHITATLRGKISPRAVPHPAVLDRPFEIQIHTGVQYAWWRATHDDIYKGSSAAGHSWAAKRASGQARASLELVDGVMADFEAAAGLQRVMGSRDEDAGESARAWLQNWPRSKRPADEVRFASTAVAVTTAAAVDRDSVTQRLTAGELAEFISNPSLTPIQVILIACHLVAGPSMFSNFASAQQRVLVTGELLAAYPAFSAFPIAQRVPV